MPALAQQFKQLLCYLPSFRFIHPVLNSQFHLLSALDAEIAGGQGEEEDLDLIDEATRKFNFWTHQIHIFFVCKFFPGAEKHIQTRKAAEARRLQEAKKRAARAAMEAAEIAAQAEVEAAEEEKKAFREAEAEGDGEAGAEEEEKNEQDDE